MIRWEMTFFERLVYRVATRVGNIAWKIDQRRYHKALDEIERLSSEIDRTSE